MVRGFNATKAKGSLNGKLATNVSYRPPLRQAADGTFGLVERDSTVASLGVS